MWVVGIQNIPQVMVEDIQKYTYHINWAIKWMRGIEGWTVGSSVIAYDKYPSPGITVVLWCCMKYIA